MADMMRLRLALAVREDGGGWTVLDDELSSRVWRSSGSASRSAPAPLDAAPGRLRRSTWTRRSPSRPGASELVVTAMDPTVLMHLEEKVKSWPNMKDSDVASSIFSDSAYGFDPVVESTDLSRTKRTTTR